MIHAMLVSFRETKHIKDGLYSVLTKESILRFKFLLFIK